MPSARYDLYFRPSLTTTSSFLGNSALKMTQIFSFFFWRKTKGPLLSQLSTLWSCFSFCRCVYLPWWLTSCPTVERQTKKHFSAFDGLYFINSNWIIPFAGENRRSVLQVPVREIIKSWMKFVKNKKMRNEIEIVTTWDGDWNGIPDTLPSSSKKRLRVSWLRSVQATIAEGGNLLSLGWSNLDRVPTRAGIKSTSKTTSGNGHAKCQLQIVISLIIRIKVFLFLNYLPEAKTRSARKLLSFFW